MPCQDLRKVLRLYCNALVSACFSSGHSSVAVGCRRQRSNDAKPGFFEERCIGGWCVSPLNKAHRDTRPGPLHRRWNVGGEGWFPQINEAAQTGRARGDCVDGESRGREARRRCEWCLRGASLE